MASSFLPPPPLPPPPPPPPACFPAAPPPAADAPAEASLLGPTPAIPAGPALAPVAKPLAFSVATSISALSFSTSASRFLWWFCTSRSLRRFSAITFSSWSTFFSKRSRCSPVRKSRFPFMASSFLPPPPLPPPPPDGFSGAFLVVVVPCLRRLKRIRPPAPPGWPLFSAWAVGAWNWFAKPGRTGWP